MPVFNQPSRRFPPHPICNLGSWVLRMYFRILRFCLNDLFRNNFRKK